ncbi:unnamed protein product [Oppiella nova]|uniref:Rab-GAP TBC domain-containing protein n=1 Tax=Oppiella nova TaxID=334625 RepID=A0A7R9QKE5_9ACAR|nr:unnamed protein product [Oppiella nova]CAG2167714.1 unnamed protein product [Oppiella nova]
MSATNTTFWKQFSSNNSSTDSNQRTSGGSGGGLGGSGGGGGQSPVGGGTKFPGRVIMKNNNYFAANQSQPVTTATGGDHQRHRQQKQRTSSLSGMPSTAASQTTPTKLSGGAAHHRQGSGGSGGGGGAHYHHKRNNSSSFEVFTASCDDAWDSTIDDCLQATNHMNNHFNSNQSAIDSRLSSNISALLIRETPSTSKPIRHSSTANNSRGDENSKPNQNQTQTTTTTATSTPNTAPIITETDPKLAKIKKIVFDDEVTDLNQLRSLAWAGIPNEVRPITWKLLLGYLPIVRSKRRQIADRKRAEYQDLVNRYYYNRPENDEIWRQIHIDIPRMQPLISIFQQPLVQGIFERILYIWSIRHPASGYVQGMNDLVTPFFVTYLSEFIPDNALSKVESFDVSTLGADTLAGVEADSFWSFTKLLDSIQDNYTFAQPGIQRLVNLLSCVVSRVDRIISTMYTL